MAANVLVVDDEQDIRQFLCDILEDEGYTVRVAEDGVRAMDLVNEQTPDLVLLDLLMPRETGTGFFRKLHGKTALKEVPVIVISGLAGRNIAVSRDVPVFDKPIDQQKLLETIRGLLDPAAKSA